ncbi:hypothetical protein ACFLU6_04325 [Acidobacteriota bacterium]
MKKTYRKPEVVLEKEIEALAGTCTSGNGDTGNTEKALVTTPGCENNTVT